MEIWYPQFSTATATSITWFAYSNARVSSPCVSVVGALMESVPNFEETWIECLGDLARYRMAMEESDLRNCQV